VEPFDDLTGSRRRELDEQAQRVGAVQEAEVDLTLGTVTAGRHL
jgi:hypothetical protein